MPDRARTPCTAPGCSRLSVLRGRCEQHKRDPRPSASKRGYDRQWQKVRDEYIAENPYCESERHVGQEVPVYDVDHRQPLSEGGARLDKKNLQSLCRSCHVLKTPRGRVG
jgi:5-methylcytosine-specific restriction enzyme A